MLQGKRRRLKAPFMNKPFEDYKFNYGRKQIQDKTSN
jgi:hypothetical protein